MRNLQEQVKKAFCFKNFTVWKNWSQNFCKLSAFSLEFQKFFSITRTIFSHSRSEQFWKQNTNSRLHCCQAAWLSQVIEGWFLIFNAYIQGVSTRSSLNSKSDVLQWSCDLDSELLIKILSLYDCPSHIASESKENYSKFGQKVSKNNFEFDIFYLRLLRLSEVKKVSNGWSGINFHY